MDLFKQIEIDCMPRIQRATVAFYFVASNWIDRDRSGVLYAIAGRHFILTAAHGLLEMVNQNIPLCIDLGDGASFPVPLNAATFHTTEAEHRDVAAILLPPDAVEQLQQTKEFLAHRDVRLSDGDADSLYVLFGFPETWSSVAEGALSSVGLAYVCRRYNGELNSDAIYEPYWHILLQFPPEGYNLRDGSTQILPRLHGASGCGIWRVCDWSREGFDRFRPEHVSLVGIQTSYFEPLNYAQGTWIGAALALIQDMYPDVAPAMSIAYPSG